MLDPKPHSLIYKPYNSKCYNREAIDITMSASDEELEGQIQKRRLEKVISRLSLCVFPCDLDRFLVRKRILNVMVLEGFKGLIWAKTKGGFKHNQ